MPECLCKHPERAVLWPFDCAKCRGIIIGAAPWPPEPAPVASRDSQQTKETP